MSIFAERLKYLRSIANISQQKAADKIGISRGVLSHYENSTREPDTAMMLKIAEFYDVSLDYLLGSNNVHKSQIDCSKFEGSVIENFLELSDSGQKDIAKYIDVMLVYEGKRKVKKIMLI